MDRAIEIASSSPRTYHTRRAQVTYEQTPWDLAHAEALYPRLAGIIEADNQWHDFPPLPHGLAAYRVSEPYFQVLFASRMNLLFKEMKSLDPPQNDHDAEWEIWRIRGGRAYAMSSTFARTPGPFPDTVETDRWMERHGLGLLCSGGFLEGVAYFAELTPGCMNDAMERLVWLEQEFNRLNQRMAEASQGFWSQIAVESEAIASQHPELVVREEIVPLPPRPESFGWKRRIPVKDPPG